MATYDDGKKELDSDYRDAAHDYDDDKYEEHGYVVNLLTASQEADQDIRSQAREAHIFLDKRDGMWEQYWYDQAKDQPRYSFDMVGPIVDQVCSEISQASFDVKVSPAGGNSTKDISNTYTGIVRNIEAMSDSAEVYSNAARGMVTGGFDAWRVTHRYVSADSFEQDLMIETIPDALDRVFFDPAATKQDKTDSRYCFVLHAIGKDEYDRRWPEGSGESVSEGRDGDVYYQKAEVVIIGELLYCEEESRELVLMTNGETYDTDSEGFEKVIDELAAIGVTETRRRNRPKKRVCSRFFDNSDWLEEKKETVFGVIPVIPIYANYKVFENKNLWHGAVEKLMDSQRVLNYSVSREVSEGALSSRSKYWMTMAQAAGHEKSLQTLNTNAEPVQFFNVDPEYPQTPAQQGGAQINAGLRTMSEAMRGMITYASGMYASNMGDNPGLQSGVAIQQLQNKGDNSTMKYFKALEFGIRATGRILVDAIPRIYDSERTVRILKEDNTYDVADINKRVLDQQTGDIVVLQDLSVGIYDVQVKAGASFQNRQQETIETIIEIAKVDPSILQIAGDVLLDNVATASAQQISDRKRAQMILANLIPEEQMTEEELQQAAINQEQGLQEPSPEMVLAQAEQMKGQAEMLRAQIEQAKLQNEQMRLQMDMQKLEMEGQRMQMDMAGDQAENQIDSFNAETRRMDTQVKAQQAGATIDKTSAQAMGEQIDNQLKMNELQLERQKQQQIQEEERLRQMRQFMSNAEIERLNRGR